MKVQKFYSTMLIIVLLMPGSLTSALKGGALSGIIFFDQSGKGYPAATITILESDYVIHSDIEGAFSLPFLPEGKYILNIQISDWNKNFKIPVSILQGLEKILKVSLQKDSTFKVAQEEAPLPNGHITGKVISPLNGLPIPNSEVTLLGVNRKTVTDSSGKFEFENIATGIYNLTATVDQCPITYVNDIAVGAGENTNVDVISGLEKKNKRTQQTGTLLGKTINLLTEKPVIGGIAYIEELKKTVVANSQGIFRFNNLPQGCYTLLYKVTGFQDIIVKNLAVLDTKVTALTFRMQQNAPPIKNLVIYSYQPGTLIVSVKPDNNEIPKSKIKIFLNDSLFSMIKDSVKNDFTLMNLQPGEYNLSIKSENYDQLEINKIFINEGDTTTQYVNLEPVEKVKKEQGRVITGVVMDSENNRSPDIVLFEILGTNKKYSSKENGEFSFSVPKLSNFVKITSPGYQPIVLDISTIINDTAGLEILIKKGKQNLVDFIYSKNNNNITGIITDEKTQKPIIDAQVNVNGFDGLMISDNGRFTFSNLPDGTYAISASAKNYATSSPITLNVKNNESKNITIPLKKEELTDLFRMTVSANAVNNTESSLLKERKLSFSVSDGISAAEISRSGGGNAADAVKKVPGITIVDGKYVYIRGLGERYVRVSLNDQGLPSPDPDKKSFPLDLFPTGLIDNIVTDKTYMVDFPGDFAGGNVNIVTKAIPDKPIINMSIKSGGNSSFTGRNILSYEGGKYDWLGFDDGSRKIPSLIDKKGTNEIPSYSMANTDTILRSNLDSYSKSFNNNFNFIHKQAFPDLSIGFTTGNKAEFAGSNIGGILALAYSKKWKGYFDGINARYEVGQNSQTSEILTPDQYRADSKFTNEILWGLLATAGIEFNKEHKVKINFLNVHNAEDRTQHLFGNVTHIDKLEARAFHYSERNLLNLQIDGVHDFYWLFPSVFSWRGSSATTYQYEPDIRYYIVEHRDDPEKNTLTYAFPSTQKPPTRIYRDLNEQAFQGYLDFKLKLEELEETKKFIKAGFSFVNKTRMYNQQYFEFKYPMPVAGTDIGALDNDVEKYFSYENMGLLKDTVIYKYNRVTRKNDTITQNTWGVVVSPMSLISDYSTKRNIPALYTMLSWDFYEKWNLVGGLRIERSALYVDMRDSSLVDEHKINNDLLYALSAQYNITHDLSLKLAHNTTLARPVDRELIDIAVFNIVTNSNDQGNKSLSQLNLRNLDVRAEWFQSNTNFLALSLFYKWISKPIEQVQSKNNDNASRVENVKKGSLLGTEFEMRFDLDIFHKYLENFRITSNIALIYSEISLSDDEIDALRQWDPTSNQTTRPLYGQSPFVYNVDLTYDNEKIGFSSGIFFNMFGPRLSVVSKGSAPDIYEQSSPLLNLTLQKKFFKVFSISFTGNNLLNSDVSKVYTFKNTDYYQTKYTTGRSGSISLNYSFK